MVFKTRIGYYTGTTDGYTDAEAKQYIIDGCYDVYKKMKSIKEQMYLKNLGYGLILL